MERNSFEAYLDELAAALHARRAFSPRILEETRNHLLESMEQRMRNGLSADEAQQQALARFGSANDLAAQFAKENSWMMQKVLLTISLGIGLILAFVDTRPTWDDTGIEMMALLISCVLLGFLGPKRPWLWALAVGIWIPLANIVVTHHVDGLIFVVVLAFAFVGAYIGMAGRKALATLTHA